MIKRTTTTTTYEYGKDGQVVKKTVVEEVYEENRNNSLTYPWLDPYYTTSDQTAPNITTITG